MDTLILTHGLWMPKVALGMLQRRLEREHGFRVVTFGYPSVTGSIADHVGRLQELARRSDSGSLHYVGHSLGGLVVLELLRRTRDLPPGRAVLLGSPLRGSVSARSLARWSLGRAMLGRGIRESVLGDPIPEWDGRRDVGVIAGSTGFGFGRAVTRLAGENDGTILVDETRLPGLCDHIVLPVTHTGLLFSPAVAAQAANFLRTGAFMRDAGALGGSRFAVSQSEEGGNAASD